MLPVRNNPLSGKKIYIPPMAYGSSRAFAAVFRAIGLDADITPPSDNRTVELGSKHTSGDECYPAKVTVGDFFKVLEQPSTDPCRVALFMPTAEGPCRFGQYAPYLRSVLDASGYRDVMVLSPTSDNSYAGLGDMAGQFVRSGWRALVAADILQKLLLRNRPHEVERGATDAAYLESLQDLCDTIERTSPKPGPQLAAMRESMLRARGRFRALKIRRDPDAPLIGIVGEIFCRLNTFSNDDLVRRLEEFGAEGWLSDIAEWVWYTNAEQFRKLRLAGRRWSKAMLIAKIRKHVQGRDEHVLFAPFHEDFLGIEEPEIEEVIELAWPYLPQDGAFGEMVLNIGKAAYMAKKGVDGVIDISPFTCMNGIVSEAIYPRLSRDLGGIPIRNVYFDGTQSDLDRDLGVYLELARAYRNRRLAACPA